MTKVKVFVYGRRRRRQRQQQQRRRSRGYDNSSPDFRHGELKMKALHTHSVNILWISAHSNTVCCGEKYVGVRGTFWRNTGPDQLSPRHVENVEWYSKQWRNIYLEKRRLVSTLFFYVYTCRVHIKPKHSRFSWYDWKFLQSKPF